MQILTAGIKLEITLNCGTNIISNLKNKLKKCIIDLDFNFSSIIEWKSTNL